MAKAKVVPPMFKCKKIEIFENVQTGNFYVKVYQRVNGRKYKLMPTKGMVRHECSLGNSVPLVPPNTDRVKLLGQIADQALNMAI